MSVNKATSYIFLFSLTLLLSCKETIIQNQPLQASGVLFIDSTPKGAEIFLQGTNTGKLTPDSIVNLQADKYELKLDYKGIDTIVNVDVKTGLKTTVYINFSNYLASLFVNSNPHGAKILINNSSTLKVTPDSIRNLTAGDYLVSVTLNNDTLYELINLSGGETKEVYFNFFGDLDIHTFPAGAQIFLDGINTYKTTPNSFYNLVPGNHTISLKLDGYLDTTIIYNIIADKQNQLNVTLRSQLLYSYFGPIRLWETTGTTAAQPSGLDLSTGVTIGLSSIDKNKIDIYYSSNGFQVKGANTATGLTRVTSFFVGPGTNINDGVDSPTATGSWASQMGDREPNYVFLYDNDLHYSKLKITSWGGGTPGNPAWVEVQYIYNEQANSKVF